MNGSKELEAGVDARRPTQGADVTTTAIASVAGASLAEDPPVATRTRRLVAGGALGVVLAVGLAGFATLMRSNASFARSNVARQLEEQEITFKPAQDLTAEEQERPCLVKYAGQPLTTGAQAQCYANQFIGVHLKAVAGGSTYARMKGIQDTLRAQIADAQARNDASVADLQRQLAEVSGKRQTLFEGETLRGLLMTSYGFGTLGAKADQAAGAATWAGAAVLAISVMVLIGAGATRSATR